MKQKLSNNLKILFIMIFLILSVITLTTQNIGTADIGSFTSSAKYFAGDYDAKIRSSHSYLWGFLNSFHVNIFESFIGFKIVNLIILFLIIYSVYFISGKDKRALFLMLLSPIIWYIAPHINSLQIASLLFLWSYYFIKKYDESNKLNHLMYSGILLGLIACVWHGILFYSIFFIFIFFYNKKTSHTIHYLISILIGMIPLFLLDFYLFGFPFHSILKNSFGTLMNIFKLGMNPNIGEIQSWIIYLVLFLIIPIYFWKLYKKENFIRDTKTMLFLTVVLLMIVKNPQIRYLILVMPIIILNLVKTLNQKQLKILFILSVIISFAIVIPYGIDRFPNDKIKEDLNIISEDYPNEVFVVGNADDYYSTLANIYWGDKVKEFVSMQDYNLFLKNTSTILERELSSSPKNLNGRREIWIKGGISKPKDSINYTSIKYAISLENELELENFQLIKKYQTLSLFGRIK